MWSSPTTAVVQVTITVPCTRGRECDAFDQLDKAVAAFFENHKQIQETQE